MPTTPILRVRNLKQGENDSTESKKKGRQEVGDIEYAPREADKAQSELGSSALGTEDTSGRPPRRRQEGSAGSSHLTEELGVRP